MRGTSACRCCRPQRVALPFTHVLTAGTVSCVRISGRAAPAAGVPASRLVRILLHRGLGGRRARQAQPQGQVPHVQSAPLHSPQRQVAAAVHALAHLVRRECIPFAPHAWGEQQCEQLYCTMRAAQQRHQFLTGRRAAAYLQGAAVRSAGRITTNTPRSRGCGAPAHSCLQASQRRIENVRWSACGCNC